MVMLNFCQFPFVKSTLLIAMCYASLGLLCSNLSGGAFVVPIPFIPEAVALATGLFFGWQCAIGVFFGELILGLWAKVSSTAAIGIALVNSIDLLIAVGLSKFLNINPRIGNFKDHLKLTCMVLLVLAPFSAFFSNALLMYSGVLNDEGAFWNSVMIWWASNSLA